MHSSESLSDISFDPVYSDQESYPLAARSLDELSLNEPLLDEPASEPPHEWFSQDSTPHPAVHSSQADSPATARSRSGPINLATQANWLGYFQRCSRLLVAVIEPTTLALQYANDYFCQLAGIPAPGMGGASGELGSALNRLLSDSEHQAVQRLYARHILHRVFWQFFQVDPAGCRLLDEPVMLTLHSPLYPEPRYIEFWLRSEQLDLTRRDPDLDEFADLGLHEKSLEQLEAMLIDPGQVQQLEQQLQICNYEVTGWLLLEGLDVTEREIIRRITQLLIDRDSILRPHKFQEVDQQMRSLFRAQNTVVLSIEGDQTRLFTGAIEQELDSNVVPLAALQSSNFLEAIRSNRVVAVPDLSINCQTFWGQKLVELGTRSLLLIPLVPLVQAEWNHIPSSSPSAIGLVALLSDRPHHFDGLDCRHAEQLIPAFTAALTAAQRQLIQQRFITNIHPAVEWRFLEEADRRSVGLPPEPIVFTNVYPLYGISDIRGSSEERNRAIQNDLLEQFRLGLAIVEAVCTEQETSLGEQLRQDLQEQIRQLEVQVTVDTEVTGVRYLRDHLEVYFDYFADCGEGAIAALSAYQTACANQHACVYRARAAYDETIAQINSLLRETWDRWQVKMQRLSPHYCDTEATDGIDHMIYAGPSIDPKFSDFHLRSLRYEQLRAICDCARTAFRLQASYATGMQVTHLVLVQDSTVDIFHDETTERLFEVRGSRDMRYEIVKKRIDKGVDESTHTRITQPGMLAVVYSTDEEWAEYQQYLRYLMREGWIETPIERGSVQPLQGVNGLKYARVRVLPEP